MLLAVAGNRYDVVVPRAGLPALAAAVLIGAVAFASLGYALASAIRTPAAAQPVASLVFLPFLLVSGVLVPADRLPDRLAAVARVFPVEHLANAIRYALDPAVAGNHLAVADLAVLAAWAVGRVPDRTPAVPVAARALAETGRTSAAGGAALRSRPCRSPRSARRSRSVGCRAARRRRPRWMRSTRPPTWEPS